MLTILPSSICLVRPLAISTGWICRLKARPKTPSTSDSIRFSMFLRMPKRNLPSPPRREVPQHRVYYSRERERNHSLGEGLRALRDHERVSENPTPDREDQPRYPPPRPLPKRDSEGHRSPQPYQEGEGRVLLAYVAQYRSYPVHEPADAQRWWNPVEPDPGVGDQPVPERQVVADEHQRTHRRREGRPNWAHERAQEKRQPCSEAGEGERHREHGSKRELANVLARRARARYPHPSHGRHEQREAKPHPVAQEGHGERHNDPQRREARQQVTRHPEASCYPEGLGAVQTQQLVACEEAEVARRRPVEQPQRHLGEAGRHLLKGLASCRHAARRGLPAGEELEGGPRALRAVGWVGRGGPVHELPQPRRRLVGLVGEEGAGRCPDGVDVRQGAGFRGAVEDLRRYVARGAHRETHAGKARVPRPVGHPEVRQLHAAPRVDEGVLRLDVAVDYALPVGVDECLEDLGQRVSNLLEAVAPCSLVERQPPDELGDEVDLVVTGDYLERLYYVLVFEGLGDLALPQGARPLARAVDGDYLDGNVPAAGDPPERARPPDGREAAASDHLGQRVTPVPLDVARLGHPRDFIL